MWASHSSSATPTNAISTRAIAPTPACWPSTHSSHTAVANIGKARPCFSRSIHGPGLGRRLRHPGATASAM